MCRWEACAGVGHRPTKVNPMMVFPRNQTFGVPHDFAVELSAIDQATKS
jgi:hypothetical protein